MPNRIFINDEGFKEIVLEGDQTLETVKKLTEESSALDKQLLEKTGTIKVLIDATKLESLNMGAVQSSMQGVAFEPYDKVGMYGLPDSNKPIVDFILAIAADKNEFQVFDTREEAIKWLSSS